MPSNRLARRRRLGAGGFNLNFNLDCDWTVGPAGQRGRSAVALLTVLAVFAAVLVAVPPREAAAQTNPSGSTLISNLGQGDPIAPVGVTQNTHIAQGFAAGFNAEGYSLSSIELDVESVANPSAVTVKVHSEDPGITPGAAVITLTNPAMTISSSGVLSFSAPANSAPVARARHSFVVVSCSSGGDSACLTVRRTSSTEADTGRAEGWSFYRSSYHGTDGSWTSDPNKLVKVRVTGTPSLGQVTGMSAAGGVDSLDVSWTAVTGATGYTVQWKSGSQSYNTTSRQATVSSGTSHTIEGLAQGTEYTVRVAATKADTPDGDWSAEDTGIPIWVGVLVVGSSSPLLGFDSDLAGLQGALAPTTVSYKGVDHEIKRIAYSTTVQSAERFRLTAQGAVTDSLTLCLGEASVGTGTYLMGDSGGATGFGTVSWTAGDKVDVALVAADESCPSSGVTTALTAPARIDNHDPFTVSLTFGESVTGLSADDFIVSSEATVGALSGSGTGWSLEVTPTNNDDIKITLPLGAARGTSGYTASSAHTTTVDVDDIKPTVVITTDDATLTGSETATVTVTFSEPVSGFTAAELTASAGALSGFSAAEGGTVYTATLAKPATGAGMINLNVAAGAASDEAGNTSTAAAQLAVAYDNASVVAVSATELTVAENGGTATFDVTLTGQPSENVQVAVSAKTGVATVRLGSAAERNTLTLTFDGTNWNTAQTVTVTGVNDDIVNPGEERTFQLQINAASSDDAFHQPSSRDRVEVSVTDDDAKPPIFTDGDTAARSINEDVGNSPGSAGNVGAAVAATDANTGEALTYSITSVGPERVAFDTKFSLDASTGQITRQSNALLDYEAKNSYSVTLGVSDPTGKTDSVDLTISLNDVTEVPQQLGRPTVAAKDDSTADTSDTLTVTWTAPSNNGRPSIIGYKVQYKLTSATEYTPYTHSGTGTTADIGGLNPESSYEVQVAATNVDGTGPWSNAEIGTTDAAADGAVTLVSNHGQQSGFLGDGPSDTEPRWQEFTTGPNAGGYSLANIVVELRGTADTSTNLKVELLASNGQLSPGTTVLHTLTDLTPSATSSGFQTFTAPAGATLDANTSYFVKFSCESGGCARYQTTTSDAEDSGGPEGWSLGNGTVVPSQSGSSHIFAGGSVKMSVNGSSVLVSNVGQTTGLTSATASNTQSYAQAFAAGADAGGYPLAGIEIDINALFSATTSGPLVEVFTVAGTVPGTRVYTLANPTLTSSTSGPRCSPRPTGRRWMRAPTISW